MSCKWLSCRRSWESSRARVYKRLLNVPESQRKFGFVSYFIEIFWGSVYIYRLYESVFGNAIRMFLKFHKLHSSLPNSWNFVKLWKHASNWTLYNCTRPRAITYTNYCAFRLHTVQRFPHENVPKLWPNFCDILYTLVPASLVLKGNRRRRGRASIRISL